MRNGASSGEFCLIIPDAILPLIRLQLDFFGDTLPYVEFTDSTDCVVYSVETLTIISACSSINSINLSAIGSCWSPVIQKNTPSSSV